MESPSGLLSTPYHSAHQLVPLNTPTLFIRLPLIFSKEPHTYKLVPSEVISVISLLISDPLKPIAEPPYAEILCQAVPSKDAIPLHSIPSKMLKTPPAHSLLLYTYRT